MEVENNILEGWVETTLGEVATFQRGFDLPKSDRTFGEYPLMVSNGQDGTHKEFKVSGPGIVTGRSGSLGNVFYIKDDFWPLNTTLWIKTFHNNDIRFVYYFLTKFPFEKYNAGSGVPTLNRNHIHPLPVLIPPLPEQKAIANVLTAFDDKIELLQAQNKTLESMAQTIFKEWFGKYQIGDELPEGWRVGVIGDLIEIKRGGSPRPIKDYISDSGYRWLKISDASATSSPYIFIIKEHIKKVGFKKTTLKHKGDLVLSNSATPGIPKFLAVDTCVHDGWMHFSNAKVSNEYLYLLFLNIRPKLLQQGSGSVFVNLKTDTLRQFETIIASKNDFETFDNLIKPIFTKIYNNALQIQSLTKTRDTLLPKLMSGQVRVKDRIDMNIEKGIKNKRSPEAAKVYSG